MNLSGEWENQNGSVMHLEDDDSGLLRGWFVSQKGRAARDRQYAVTGVKNGELASLAVSFVDDDADLGSITTFSCRWARSRDGVEQLHSVWILARMFEDEARAKPTHPWNTFLVNSDVFTKVGER